MTLSSKSRILVTGGKGFLGTHVIEKLKSRGYDNVIAPDKNDYDLCDIDDVKRIMRDSKPNVVIHLAAKVGGIGLNLDKPAEYNDLSYPPKT